MTHGSGGPWSARVWWPAGLEPSRVTAAERDALLADGAWPTGEGRLLGRDGTLREPVPLSLFLAREAERGRT